MLTFTSAGSIPQTTTSIQLRELRVRPRVSRWNVVVGSLWIDVDRGLLVRAAYRLAEPIDIGARVADDSANAEQLPGADGPVRLDAARGISPRTSWRADLTLESRF